MPRTYSDLVELYLWAPWKHAADNCDTVACFRIAIHEREIPEEWIALVAESERERVKWKASEMKHGS